MKIISKFKDYYDHIQGLYGVDEKIVYDRTEIKYSTPSHIQFPSTEVKYFILAICDIFYIVYYFNGVYYFGDVQDINGHRYVNGELIPERYLKYKWYKTSKELHLTKTDINTKNNEPILLISGNRMDKVSKDIKLSDYGINKLVEANDMYIMISNWLSKEKEIEDNRTDKEKIVGKGFDYKKSFRKM